MRKKLFSIILAVATLFSCFALSGCKDVYDYKPESYGEWDGNYVYSGNYRSKTTGEDGERLVSEVVDEGITYQVELNNRNYSENSYTFYYYGDFIYLVMNGEAVDEDLEKKEKRFLVRYNLKEKTQETVLAETEELFEGISYVNDERIVLLDDERWYAVDFNGNLIEENFPGTRTTVLNQEYLVYKSYPDGEIMYRSFANPLEYKIMDGVISLNYRYYYIENENQKGILICNTNDGALIYDFWFFDLETNTLHTIAENYNQKLRWVGDDYKYFITYEMGLVEWTEKGSSCAGVQEKSATISLNCKMYTVDYENYSIREVYKFPRERNCTQVNILNDGKIYVTQTWFEDYKFLKNDGGKAYARYRFDTESETFSLVSEEEYDELFDQPSQGEWVVCGEYEYYQTVKYVPLMMGRSYAYSLVRTDGVKTETMQFFTSRGKESDLEIGARACFEMWNQNSDGKFSNFIVRPY